VKMGDWAILRLDLDNPEEGDLVKILANVPLDWKKYTSKVAEEYSKPGRYVPVLLLYDKEAYFPVELEQHYKAVEKDSLEGR